MGKAEQKSTEYIPSKTEQRLLETLSDPASRLKTVTEICKTCGIDRKTYYRHFKKPEFLSLYREITLSTIKNHTAPVANALVREAVRGSHHHIKMVLQIADIYTEKEEITIKGNFAEELQKAIEAKKRREKEAIDGSDPTGRR